MRHRVASALSMTVVATVIGGLWFRARPRTPFARMMSVAESLPVRTVEGRLAGHPYSPFRRLAEGSPSLLQLRGAAGEVMISSAAAADAHLNGVAALLSGKSHVAVDKLRGAANQQPAARYWNDVAAAELADASSSGNAERLPHALAAVDHALQIDANLPEALFNRALILEHLRLRRAAVVAWERYLTDDGDSEWAEETRGRLTRLRRRSRSEMWTDEVASLYRASTSGDGAMIRAIARRFTQPARTWSEGVFLEEWGSAVLSGDAVRARQRLMLTGEIGAALAEYRGETLLSEAVLAIRQSSPDRCRLLAKAHVQYRRARNVFASRRFSQSRRMFLECATQFASAGSPMALVARYNAANSAFEANDIGTALEELNALYANVSPQYPALRAQVAWERGAALGKSGSAGRALEGFREALTIFDRLEEEDHGNAIRIAIASTLDLLGRHAEAWQLRVQWFERLSESGSSLPLQTALDSTARVAMAAGQWDVGWSFMGLAIEPHLHAPNTRVAFEDRVWRALAAFRLGWSDSAKSDIERAAAQARSISEPAEREGAMSRVAFARAIILRKTNASAAAAEADRAVAYLVSHADRYYLPEILLERARSLRALGRVDDAIADLQNGMDLIEERRGLLSDDLRDSYFSAADGVTAELFDLLESRGSAAEAFGIAERTRSRIFIDRIESRPLSAAEISRRLQPGVSFVQYAVLNDRIVIHTIDRKGLRSYLSRCSSEMVASRLHRFRESIVSGVGIDDENRSLYQLLVQPIEGALADTTLLVINPDRTLADVPFAALADSSGRRLIEKTQIVYAPNATLYVHRSSESADGWRDTLVVGNPSVDRRLVGDLPPLPEAEREANEIARASHGTLLTGDLATPAAVLRVLRRSSVVHFGTHALIDAVDPRRSCLVLAAEHDRSSVLRVSEIAALHLDRVRLVNLAGCRTAIAADSPGDIRSLSTAFLAAGAHSVAGTLWNIDDAAARAVSVAFHAALMKRAATPASALRDVQISMMRSSNPQLRDVRTWGAIQLLGSGR